MGRDAVNRDPIREEGQLTDTGIVGKVSDDETVCNKTTMQEDEQRSHCCTFQAEMKANTLITIMLQVNEANLPNEPI
jgi:hypothetical protein